MTNRIQNREISWDWLLGFIEGEGSFAITIKKAEYGMGYQVIVYFQMGQIYSEGNRLLFIKIQKFLQKHGIKANFNKYRWTWKGNGNTWFFVKMTIYGLDNCLKFTSYLKKLKWHTGKELIFLNWVKALKVLESGEYKTPKGLRKILALRDNVSKIKKYKTYEIKQMLANNTKWRNWLEKSNIARGRKR